MRGGCLALFLLRFDFSPRRQERRTDMEPTTATPAGAAAIADASTETVSATVVAAEQGDVSTFLDADRAARQGKPVEKVTRAKAAPAKAAPGPVVVGKGGEPAKGPSAAD